MFLVEKRYKDFLILEKDIQAIFKHTTKRFQLPKIESDEECEESKDTSFFQHKINALENYLQVK